MIQTGMIGLPKEGLDSPVLLVDLAVMESNIERMAHTIIREAGVRWRPHTKGIKSPALAHMLLEAGASGITCAKLGEAEVMVEAGIRDILIANQIVGPQKIARLVNLRRYASVKVAVDSVENIDALSAAARKKGVELEIVIEVDVGMNRAGVEPGESTVALAREIRARQNLRFAGLMTWESTALKITDPDKKRQAVAAALARLTTTAQQCRDEGMAVDIVSCGGTGTYWLSSFVEGITEVQAGGGIFCDVNYRRNLGVEHPYALTVLATVTSRPTPTRIVCDAGKKSMNCETAAPAVVGLSGVGEIRLSAEHGTIELTTPNTEPRIGDKIEFVVGYADLTVALYDELYGIRDGLVETAWPLLGRGRLQ